MERTTSSFSDERPEVCKNCVFCCPWNGEGWGCGHATVNGLLDNICRCDGKHFVQFKPFKMARVDSNHR